MRPLSHLFQDESHIEPLHYLLDLLSVKDLLQCQQTCKHLNQVISHSSKLQLHLRQAYHVIPPLTTTLPPADQLNKLINTERRLQNLTPETLQCIHINHSIVIGVQNGLMLVAESSLKLDKPDQQPGYALDAWTVWQLPGRISTSSEKDQDLVGATKVQGLWRWRNEFRKPFQTIAMCEEDNLLVIGCYSTEIPNDDPSGPPLISHRYYLYTLLDGHDRHDRPSPHAHPLAHPHAKIPFIELITSRLPLGERPVVRLMPGGLLAIHMTAHGHSTIWIANWHKGLCLGVIHAPFIFEDFAFLTPEAIISVVHDIPTPSNHEDDLSLSPASLLSPPLCTSLKINLLPKASDAIPPSANQSIFDPSYHPEPIGAFEESHCSWTVIDFGSLPNATPCISLDLPTYHPGRQIPNLPVLDRFNFPYMRFTTPFRPIRTAMAFEPVKPDTTHSQLQARPLVLHVFGAACDGTKPGLVRIAIPLVDIFFFLSDMTIARLRTNDYLLDGKVIKKLETLAADGLPDFDLIGFWNYARDLWYGTDSDTIPRQCHPSPRADGVREDQDDHQDTDHTPWTGDLELESSLFQRLLHLDIRDDLLWDHPLVSGSKVIRLDIKPDISAGRTLSAVLRLMDYNENLDGSSVSLTKPLGSIAITSPNATAASTQLADDPPKLETTIRKCQLVKPIPRPTFSAKVTKHEMLHKHVKISTKEIYQEPELPSRCFYRETTREIELDLTRQYRGMMFDGQHVVMAVVSDLVASDFLGDTDTETVLSLEKRSEYFDLLRRCVRPCERPPCEKDHAMQEGG